MPNPPSLVLITTTRIARIEWPSKKFMWNWQMLKCYQKLKEPILNWKSLCPEKMVKFTFPRDQIKRNQRTKLVKQKATTSKAKSSMKWNFEKVDNFYRIKEEEVNYQPLRGTSNAVAAISWLLLVIPLSLYSVSLVVPNLSAISSTVLPSSTKCA